MKNVLASALLIASLNLLAQDARACSCAMVSLEEQLEYADYAFAGLVLDVDTVTTNSSLTSYLIATISVDRVWKGDVPSVFKVWTRSNSASCGYNDPWARFEIGETFVLYAFAPSDDIGHVSTHLCTRNAKYDDAGEDLVRLGKGSTPLPTEGDAAPAFSLHVPHPHPITSRATLTLEVDRTQHVTVEVFDALGRRVAVLMDDLAEANGHHPLTFEAESLPSGLYLVRADGASASLVKTVVVNR